jgi:hypothetical protein
MVTCFAVTDKNVDVVEVKKQRRRRPAVKIRGGGLKLACLPSRMNDILHEPSRTNFHS